MQHPPLLDPCMESSTPKAVCCLRISSEVFLYIKTYFGVGQGDGPGRLHYFLDQDEKFSVCTHTQERYDTYPRETDEMMIGQHGTLRLQKTVISLVEARAPERKSYLLKTHGWSWAVLGSRPPSPDSHLSVPSPVTV